MPTKLLASRCKAVSDVNDPMLLGIVPFNIFLSSDNSFNDVNDPILLGIVPTNDRLPNLVLVTLAYVADPLSVSHVTP